MKRLIFFFVLVLALVFALAQTNSVKNNKTGSAQRPSADIKPDEGTIRSLRTRAISSKTVQLTDRPGIYVLDPNDKSTPDNGGTVIVSANGGRYKSTQKVITPALFGATATGVADDRVALNAALQYAANNSLPFEWEPGVYNISGPISVKLSERSGAMNRGGKRLSIKGAGIANTVIRYTGTAAITVFNIAGTTDDYLNIDGLRIVTSPENHKLRNSTALKVSNLANFHLSNMAVSFFDIGVNLTNAGEGLITNLTTEWNNRGLYAGPAGASGTAVAPNAIHFNSCAFNSNVQYGIFIENGCNNTFTACRFLGNGSDDGGRAVRINYTGQNGGVSISMIGGYFEGTRGIDVEIISSSGGAHYFAGNTFNKFNNTRFANTHIKFTPLNLVADDKKINVITMLSNSMWSTPNYTPKESRPTVICDYGMNGYNGWIVEDNNYYHNPVEAPVYSGSAKLKYASNNDGGSYAITSASASDGVLNMSNRNEQYIFLSNKSGTAINKIVSNKVGKLLILQADNNITLKHTANLLLRNRTDFTFSPGQTITLFCQAPNVFREIARQ